MAHHRQIKLSQKYELSHPEFEGENFVKLVDTSYKLLVRRSISLKRSVWEYFKNIEASVRYNSDFPN